MSRRADKAARLSNPLLLEAARLEVAVLQTLSPTDEEVGTLQMACELEVRRTISALVPAPDVLVHLQDAIAIVEGAPPPESWLVDALSIVDAVDLVCDCEPTGALLHVNAAERLVFDETLKRWDDTLLRACGIDPGEPAEASKDDAVASDDSVVADRDEPLPPAFEERIPALVGRLRVSFDRELERGCRALECAYRLSRDEVKTLALEQGAKWAWAERGKPWVPRRDSRRPPIIPRDLDAAQLLQWLERETFRAAKCFIRDVPYPPSQEDRFILESDASGSPATGDGPLELGSSYDDDEQGSVLDRQNLRNIAARSGIVTRNYVPQTSDDDDNDDDLSDVASQLARYAQAQDEACEVVRNVASEATPAQFEILMTFLELAVSSRHPTWTDIAERLHISPKTVREQVARIRNGHARARSKVDRR